MGSGSKLQLRVVLKIATISSKEIGLLFLITAFVFLATGCFEIPERPDLPNTWHHTSAPVNFDPESIPARTFIYWHDSRNIIEQVFEIGEDRFYSPEGIPPAVKPEVWGELISRLESLPIEGVDDDALEAILVVIQAMSDMEVQMQGLWPQMVMAASSGDFEAAPLVSIENVNYMASLFRDADAKLRLAKRKLDQRYSPLTFMKPRLY